MNKIFKPYLYDFVLVYLDDILVFSKTPDEHLVHIRKVLELLREHGLHAKASKTLMNTNEVQYLGFLVSQEGLRVDPNKTDAIKHWPAPTDATGVRSFLGLTNYFRKFVQGYAALCKPLTALTCKDVPFVWSAECSSAFQQLKNALITAPVLVLPDPSKPYEVVCDASGFGIGAVLLQDGRPVCFDSRKLSSAEKNYSATEQELLAVVHAMRTWRCYLEGAKAITVVTDHRPNTFFDTADLIGHRRRTRWSELLSIFKFDWAYRPGRDNIADPLSRSPALLNSLFVLTRSQQRKASTTQTVEASQPSKLSKPVSSDSANISLVHVYYFESSIVYLSARQLGSVFHCKLFRHSQSVLL